MVHIDEKKLKQEEQIRAYAEIYARNLIMYGVDVREKLETATLVSHSLNQAYMRGRQDECNIRWIPCCERLPEKSGVYLISHKCCPYPILGYYTKTSKCWSDVNRYDDMLIYVVAWQPLPVPYK